MTFKEFQDVLWPFVCPELRPAVAAAFHHVQRHFDPGGFVFIGQPLALFETDQWVDRALHDEERRRFLGNPRDGARFARELQFFVNGSAE